MTASRVARVFTSLFVAWVALTACGATEEAAPPSESMFANWPNQLEGFRFRWTAEPGIDLLSGPAVPLRGYLESHRIGDLTGDAEDAYPGFSRAVPHPGKPKDDARTDLPYEVRYIQPGTDFPAVGFRTLPPDVRFYGNEYFHILELSPTEDGDGYRAYVCDGRYNIFYGTDTGPFEPLYPAGESSPDSEISEIRVWRVEFTDHPVLPTPDAPPAVTTSQKGPSPAPLGDIFGPWQITGAHNGGSWGPRGSATYDGWEERRKQCRDLMPHNAAQRQQIYSSTLNTPPIPEPAVPGWPDNVA